MTSLIASTTAGLSGTSTTFTVPAGVTTAHRCLLLLSTNTSTSAAGNTAMFSTNQAAFIKEIEHPAGENNSEVAVWLANGGLTAGTSITVSSTFTRTASIVFLAYDTASKNVVIIGTPGTRGGTTQSTTTAPSITTTAASQDVLLLATERTSTDGTTVTSVSGAPATVTKDYFTEFAATTDSSWYAGHYTKATAGATGAVTLTYSNASGNGVAVQLAVAAATGTADTTAPTVPGSVTATANTATQVTVAWAASTDAVGVTSYRVQRGGVTLSAGSRVTGLSFTDTTAAGATSYSYTVSAVDAAGNRSAESTAATVTTPAAQQITLTATPDPTSAPPRVRLDIVSTGATPVTQVVISRQDATGGVRTVRTADDGPLPLSGGSATIWDYEVPYGTTVTFSTDVAGGPTTSALLDVADVWLIHIGVPSRSMPLPKVASRGARSRPSSRGLHQVIARPDPVPISSGARAEASSQLVVRTRTDAERQALDLLLDDDAPLLLNIPPAKQWGMDTAYVSVGDLAETPTVAYGRFPYREWQLPYQVITRPGGGTQAAVTWRTVADQFSSWRAVKAAGAPSWAVFAASVT